MFQPDGYEKSEAVVKLRPFRDFGTSGVLLNVLSPFEEFYQRPLIFRHSRLGCFCRCSQICSPAVAAVGRPRQLPVGTFGAAAGLLEHLGRPGLPQLRPGVSGAPQSRPQNPPRLLRPPDTTTSKLGHFSKVLKVTQNLRLIK